MCKGLRKVIADAVFTTRRDKWCHHSRRDLRLIRTVYHYARVRPRAFVFAGARANAAQELARERVDKRVVSTSESMRENTINTSHR